MEITTAYTFGVLTVIAITFVIVLVMGIVKVLKQQKMIEGINQEIELNNQQFHRNMDDQYRVIKTRVDEAYQHIDSRVDKLEAKLTTKINK